MISIKKALLIIALLLAAFIANLSSRVDCAPIEDFLKIRGEAAILVDGKSGRVLYTQNANELLPTASMAKMMTEYLALEAIKEGRIRWDQEVNISDYAYAISQNLKLSNVPLRKDLKYTVKELYEAMAIYSANGATIALAELIGGSEENFIRMMNEKAKTLGLKEYNFVNSTGLNNSDLQGRHPAGTGRNDENMMSARATATLAYQLIHDYPEVFRTSAIPKKIFREGTPDQISMSNWNWMLPGLIYGYEGMDGLKTGSTELAGYSFTGTAERNGARLISVVMKTASIGARFAETRKLMNYGFSNYYMKEIVPAGYQIEGESEIPVTGGRQRTVEVQAGAPLRILVKRGEEELYQPVYMLDKSLLDKSGALKAPLKKGEVVGKVTVEYKGEGPVVYLTEEGKERESVDLVTVHAVERAGLFTRFIRWLGRLFSDLWRSLWELVR